MAGSRPPGDDRSGPDDGGQHGLELELGLGQLGGSGSDPATTPTPAIRSGPATLDLGRADAHGPAAVAVRVHPPHRSARSGPARAPPPRRCSPRAAAGGRPPDGRAGMDGGDQIHGRGEGPAQIDRRSSCPGGPASPGAPDAGTWGTVSCVAVRRQARPDTASTTSRCSLAFLGRRQQTVGQLVVARRRGRSGPRCRRGARERTCSPRRSTSSSGLAPTKPSTEKTMHEGYDDRSRRATARRAARAGRRPPSPRGPGRPWPGHLPTTTLVASPTSPHQASRRHGRADPVLPRCSLAPVGLRVEPAAGGSPRVQGRGSDAGDRQPARAVGLAADQHRRDHHLGPSRRGENGSAPTATGGWGPSDSMAPSGGHHARRPSATVAQAHRHTRRHAPPGQAHTVCPLPQHALVAGHSTRSTAVSSGHRRRHQLVPVTGPPVTGPPATGLPVTGETGVTDRVPTSSWTTPPDNVRRWTSGKPAAATDATSCLDRREVVDRPGEVPVGDGRRTSAAPIRGHDAGEVEVVTETQGGVRGLGHLQEADPPAGADDPGQLGQEGGQVHQVPQGEAAGGPVHRARRAGGARSTSARTRGAVVCAAASMPADRSKPIGARPAPGQVGAEVARPAGQIGHRRSRRGGRGRPPWPVATAGRGRRS